jgi:HD-GYP domain-containing protein (c-di-GMP phosphodiesterase class II)
MQRVFAGDRLRLLWLLTWTVPAALQFGLARFAASFGIVGSAVALFWLVLIAASLCVVAAGAVLVRSIRRRETELGYVGLFFMAVSLLPLVHGITTPGVLYGDNQATISSAQWSVPVALVLAGPLLGSSGRRAISGSWWGRAPALRWMAIGLATLVLLSGGLLVNTGLLPVLGPGSWSAGALALVCVGGCVVLSHRHLYLARVAGSPAPLVVSAGFGFVGASTLMWFGAIPFSAGFWVAHALDIAGVFAGTIGALVVLRSTSRVREAIEPVLATEPLAALELGLDPIVHRFVADLEAYDPITRDHVIRTAELAVDVGRELGLSGRELRRLGLAALLHDVGKLELPPEIINKPGRLTDAEYEIVKGHPVYGQTMVESSSALHDIGPLVRGHHERVDGGGYPDRLIGDEIPLSARIVAVCDSYDAMANSRQYREGMGSDRAQSILREHAGTQWDAAVVAAAGRVVSRKPEPLRPALDEVGRGPSVGQASAVGCDCLPAQAVAVAGEHQ